MTKLILSTANILGGNSPIARRPNQKSNVELTSGLRANFIAAQRASQRASKGGGDSSSCSSGRSSPRTHPLVPQPHFSEWTAETTEKTRFVPQIDPKRPGLSEEKESYEITVKMFFLPNTPVKLRSTQAREAVDFVLKELRVPSIDLLIVSFPGLSFDAESGQLLDEADLEAGARPEDVDSMIATWKVFEELHDQKLVSKLGVAEFGTDRLAYFLEKARIRPRVNQINVKDCCIVPKSLILFAKQEKVELLTHNDCTNILPRGTTRELLGHSEQGFGVLADADHPDGVKGDVVPQWVVKYTAVVKNRGVIENKGYFAMAEVGSA